MPRPAEEPILEIQDLEIERGIVDVDFEIGDNVVYPHHGAGQVVKKEEKNILGEVREYLTIKILHNDMTVMVPSAHAGKAGLRRVIDEDTVRKILSVLAADPPEDIPKNWNRRFKYHRDKIKTGNVYELAEVVRNLAVREHDEGLSTGEKQMYTRAKKILASEMMYPLEKTEEAAERYLDEHLERMWARDRALRSGAANTGVIDVVRRADDPHRAQDADDDSVSSALPVEFSSPSDSGAVPGSSTLSSQPSEIAGTSELDRLLSLIARSNELGRAIATDLAALEMIGQRDPTSAELSTSVRRRVRELEERAETKGRLARLLRRYRA